MPPRGEGGRWSAAGGHNMEGRRLEVEGGMASPPGVVVVVVVVGGAGGMMAGVGARCWCCCHSGRRQRRRPWGCKGEGPLETH